MENPLDETHPYAPYLASHLPSEFGTLPGADGTPLYYELIRPAGFDETGSYPVVVFTYGGPGGARVQRDWSADFNQLLAREGFVVFSVDNRGTGRRSTDFDDPIYRAMGSVEIDDQVAGVRWLAAQPGIDGSRVGIYGGSYGGYMTLLALFRAPEVFAAGAALSPVVDWRLYDTHYTERYMGDPAVGDAYWQSSPIAWVDGLDDPLLLVHGMADDNVFFSHSVQLMAALARGITALRADDLSRQAAPDHRRAGTRAPVPDAAGFLPAPPGRQRRSAGPLIRTVTHGPAAHRHHSHRAHGAVRLG